MFLKVLEKWITISSYSQIFFKIGVFLKILQYRESFKNSFVNTAAQLAGSK